MVDIILFQLNCPQNVNTVLTATEQVFLSWALSIRTCAMHVMTVIPPHSLFQ